MKKRLLFWLTTAAMQGSCGVSIPGTAPTAAAVDSTTASAAANSNSPTLLPSSTPLAQQAHYIGRFASDTATNQMQFAWSGAAAEVAFTGTGLQAQVGDTNVVYKDNEVAHNVLDVAVDGNWIQSIVLGVGLSSIDLATNLAPGQHTLRIIKRTEALVGTSVLGGFVPIDGNLMTPPKAAAYQIAFYGVSNETGYGDLASVTVADMCTFSYATEDSDKAYPAIVAASLGAELTNISYAGKGIINNGYPLYDPQPLPSLYNLVDPSNPNLTVDFSGPEPQVVGVDLGGNDFDNGTPDAYAFTQAYTQFLTTLRQRYPHVPIICVMSPMMIGDNRTNMGTWINDAIQARSQAGDDNITFLPFDVYTGTTYGCNYHPSADLQASMATVFAQQVRTVASVSD
jgi:hypothetical protein